MSPVEDGTTRQPIRHDSAPRARLCSDERDLLAGPHDPLGVRNRLREDPESAQSDILLDPSVVPGDRLHGRAKWTPEVEDAHFFGRCRGEIARRVLGNLRAVTRNLNI